MATPQPSSRFVAKATSFGGVAARRSAALARQHAARATRTSEMRELLAAHDQEANQQEVHGANASMGSASDHIATDIAASPSAASSGRHAGVEADWHRARRFDFASRLCTPTWMAALPTDATEQWMLLSRPEGLRCLVIASYGRTISRKKNGSFLHRFSSPLPHGHPSSTPPAASAPSVATILDCVWSEPARAYFVLDCPVWNGVDSLGSSSSELRLAWLRDKFLELGGLWSTAPNAPDHTMLSLLPTSTSPYAFHFLLPRVCTAAVWATVYPSDPLLALVPCAAVASTASPSAAAASSSATGVRLDGYLLLHRATAYELGHSELLLQWKDAQCSPWPLDTGGGEKQQVTLRLAADRRLHCEGGEVAGVLDEYTYQTLPSRSSATSRKGKSHAVTGDQLLQFTIDGLDEEAESAAHEQPTTSDESVATSLLLPALHLRGLAFVKLASSARLVADARDKIVFQAAARSGHQLDAHAIANQLREQEQLARHQSQPRHPSMADSTMME